jgi:hypothetical protein
MNCVKLRGKRGRVDNKRGLCEGIIQPTRIGREGVKPEEIASLQTVCPDF